MMEGSSGELVVMVSVISTGWFAGGAGSEMGGAGTGRVTPQLWIPHAWMWVDMGRCSLVLGMPLHVGRMLGWRR